MKEKFLVKKLRKKLEGTVGGFWFKSHGGPFQLVGLPDLIGCVEGLFIGIEVKQLGKLGKVTARQQFVLGLITKAGGLAFVTDDVLTAVKKVKRWLPGKRKPSP